MKTFFEWLKSNSVIISTAILFFTFIEQAVTNIINAIKRVVGVFRRLARPTQATIDRRTGKMKIDRKHRK